MKKLKKPKLRPTRPKREKYSEESRGAETVTIGWMLAAATTLLTETAALFAYALSAAAPAAGIFARYMFFAAMVIGLIGALLTLVVYRFRRVNPPRGVTVVVLIVTIAPLPLWLVTFGLLG